MLYGLMSHLNQEQVSFSHTLYKIKLFQDELPFWFSLGSSTAFLLINLREGGFKHLNA